MRFQRFKVRTLMIAESIDAKRSFGYTRRTRPRNQPAVRHRLDRANLRACLRHSKRQTERWRSYGMPRDFRGVNCVLPAGVQKLLALGGEAGDATPGGVPYVPAPAAQRSFGWPKSDSSVAASTGLTTCSSHPASRARRRSSSCP